MRGTRLMDLKGRRFGRLTVICRAPNKKGTSSAQWLCRCKCKRKVVVASASLRRKLTKSCGCLAAECRLDPTLKFRLHGAARHGKGQRTPEYVCWITLRQRCTNPNKEGHASYLGLEVCKHWSGRNGFNQFLADMGQKPEPKKSFSIDRINNDFGYLCWRCAGKTQCRWATAKMQRANQKRVIQQIQENTALAA